MCMIPLLFIVPPLTIVQKRIQEIFKGGNRSIQERNAVTASLDFFSPSWEVLHLARLK